MQSSVGWELLVLIIDQQIKKKDKQHTQRIWIPMHTLDSEPIFALKQKISYPLKEFTKIYFVRMSIHSDKFWYICHVEGRTDINKYKIF